MKLYHYSTWRGGPISLYRRIYPSTRHNKLSNTKLTFLTLNEWWETSLQAQSFEGYHEKCGSHPDCYEQLRIPCWKFQVESCKALWFFNVQLNNFQWEKTMMDAWKLGSNMREWFVTYQTVNVIKAWKWRKGGWRVR